MTLTSRDILSISGRGLFRRWWGAFLGVVLGGLGLMTMSLVDLRAHESDTPTSSDDENKAPRPGMDRFDMRVAEEPAQIEKLSLVKKSFERRRWDEGVQQLQALLDEDQDSVVFGDDHNWHPLSDVVIDLIRQSPQEALSAYIARFGALAGRDLAQARRARDVPAMLQVSRRFLLTPAGQQASRELIDALIDHGNADCIAKLTTDLLRIESTQLDDIHWRETLSHVLRESGYKTLAAKLPELPESQPAPHSNEAAWEWSAFGQPPTALRDWSTLSGSPTGQATVQTQETTLLPRWRQPLVTSPRVRKLLENQSLFFQDQGAMGLSVLSTVGSGEILITRTLSNLSAVNINTGELLWTSHEWGLASTDDLPEVEDIERQIEMYIERDSEGALSDRIRKRMTACGSLGTLSANDRYVFSLASFNSEETPLESMIQPGFEESENPDKFLFARELKTGRIAWRAGGPSSHEATGLPAAGVSFFGPPTPDGDELFVVGERDGDILLFCLEADTGLVRWEQLLAAAGRRLQEDVVRRSWAAPVAVRGSLAICPTTTGWITAVDRITRRILWTQRVINRAIDNSTAPEIDLAFDAPNRDIGIDERWPPLQPILLRDRVLFAPIELPEETGATLPRLFCYDLLTGEKLWEIPKNQTVGVIGATEDLVYLFDQLTIQAYRTDTGVQAWSCFSLNAPIAGRPVLTQDGIVVPTLPYSLVRVNAEQGKVIERTSIGIGDHPLSNLQQILSPESSRALSLGTLYSLGGRLVSVSPFEMTAFEWESDEPQWQTEAPTNAAARLKWAKSLTLRGQYAEAAQTLRDAIPDANSDEAVSALSRKMLASLLLIQAEIQRENAKPDDHWRSWLSEAKTLATSPEDMEAIQRQEIELDIHSGHWDAAWVLIRTAIRQPLRFRVMIDQRTIHPDVWLADQILAVAQLPDRTLGDAIRESIHSDFLSLWKEAAANRDSRQRLLRLFAETPFVDQTEMESLVADTAPGKLARLEALTHSRDRTTAITASVQLIELLANTDWVGDARRRLSDLPDQTSWPEDLHPTREELNQLLAPISDGHRQPAKSWQGAEIELVRWAESDSERDSELPVHWIGEPNESLQNYHYTFDTERETLILERQDGSRYCELPLSTGGVPQDFPASPVLYGAGLNIYLIHTGMIHACSIPDKQILWTRNGSLNSDHDPRRYSQHNLPVPLQNPKTLQDQHENYASQFPATSFEVANSRQVVIRSRRGIEVLCALTGQLLWELPDCPNENVRCDEDRLYRIGSSRVRAFSIRSGRPMQIPGRSEFSSMVFPLDLSGITTLTELPGEGQNWSLTGNRVQAEPITGRTETDHERWDESDQLRIEPAWSMHFGMSSRLGAGPSGQGVLLDASGEFKSIQWESGRTQLMGKIDLNQAHESDSTTNGPTDYCVWDRNHIYLISDSSPGQAFLDCPAVPIHGNVIAFSRESSELRWKYTFDGFLLTNSMDRCPFLPLIRLEESQVSEYTYQKVQLSLIDKQSGQLAYDLNTKSFGIGISHCEYDPKTQRLEILLSREKMRIRKKVGKSP